MDIECDEAIATQLRGMTFPRQHLRHNQFRWL